MHSPMHISPIPPPCVPRHQPHSSRTRRPPPSTLVASWLLLLLLLLATSSTAAPAASRDANKLPSCASSYALWNRDIPAEFDLGFLSVTSGFECAAHVVGGAYARVAVYKKSEGRCYMKGVPKSSEGTLHGHRGEVLGTHRIPGHVVTSATFGASGGASTQSTLGRVLDEDEPPYNWAHVFDSSAEEPGANCDLVFRDGDKFECQRFKECEDCVMYVGWNCGADEQDEEEVAADEDDSIKEATSPKEGGEEVVDSEAASGAGEKVEDQKHDKEANVN